MEKYIIDGNAKPVVPEGFTLVEHQKNGILTWSDGLIDLFKYESGIGGTELRRRLNTFPVLNANVANFLLSHPELKPEHWEKHEHIYISFWGTVYATTAEVLMKQQEYSGFSKEIYLVVPVLNLKKWKIGYWTVDNGWGGSTIALLRWDY